MPRLSGSARRSTTSRKFSAAADVAIEVFAMESALARAERARAADRPDLAELHGDLARVYVATGTQRLLGPLQRALGYVAGPTSSLQSELVARGPLGQRGRDRDWSTNRRPHRRRRGLANRELRREPL